MILEAVNLNGPGTYVHWSIFTISLANLVLIGVMVVIFGAALVLPFPKDRKPAPVAPADEENGDQPPFDDADMSKMWTSRLRRRAVSLLPPGKMLPDVQPAYVSSWVYVFGVASLSALALAIVSGAAIALGGVDWWHTNPVGHFFNSLHLWSVELFMAFIVIHLWGKFWMAAWRGRRALTWITGVVAFAVSVVECFTGYLSQQNFDSQWISTNGKDAINASGLGGLFDLMNFGQMLLWHVVLVPIALIAIVGAHVLLVRVRGVSHPLPEGRPKSRPEKRAQREADAAPWRGPVRRYDVLKEATAAGTIALVLVVVLSVFLSSPDEPPVTVATWAKVAPADFLATAASELAGTSETATYGPPYNNGSAFVQGIGPSWQRLAGVMTPINPARAFVLQPLAKVAPTDPRLASALDTYAHASTKQRATWDSAYLTAVTKVSFAHGSPVTPQANDGPVPMLASTELTLARSGALDADLLAEHPFYGTDFTKPLLFLEDGSYFSSLAQADHLKGSQWGVMNETGSFPGQPWLWLYTLWYQLPGLRTSSNIDLIAVYLTGVATLLLLAIPFVPGLRDIPSVVPLHRLVWREWRKKATASDEN
ncbi:MAG: cytochrome b N-terminal domain-containing protein [Acidimicrobiales bacterium]